MKNFKTILAVALATLSLASCNCRPAVGDVKAPSAGLTDSASYLIGINFGYFIKANGFGENLDLAAIKEGMLDFINNEYPMSQDSAFNAQFRIAPDMMNQVLGAYIEQERAYNAAKEKAAGEKFLTKNAQKDGVITTDSGLQYQIIEPGNDVRATAASQVRVNYKGTLLDGTVFDENDGAQFTLSHVIPAWTEGMCLVGEGGKIKLFVPSDLGYGDRGAGEEIKPGATLIFEVELLQVVTNPAVPAGETTEDAE